MLRRISLAVFAAMILCAPAPALAHGGGGGGHGGGGGYVYMPVYVPPPQLPAAQTAAMDKIHTVALISAIGQHFDLEYVSFWSTKTKDLDISSWALDDFTVAELKKRLGGRFTFKDVPYDRTALAAIPNGMMSNSTSKLQKYLASVPSDGIDAFMVVRPDQEYGAPGVEGLGLLAGSAYPSASAWLNFEIDIVDPRTWTIIAKAYSRAQLRQGEPPTFAGFDVPNDFAPASDLSLTDAQMKGLQAGFEHSLDVTLTETLRSLALGATLPDVGARTIVPLAADADPLKAIKTVAVVSAIGDQMTFEHQSLFRSDAHVAMPGPDLDAQIEAQIKGAIAKRFVVKDAPIDRAKLYGARFLNANGVWRDTVSELPPDADIDAYVVVLKHPVFIPGLSDNEGVGLWRAGIADQTLVYTGYAVALVDAHSLKVLEGHTALMPPTVAQSQPFKAVDATLWPDKPDAPAPSTLASIRSNVDDVLAESIPETLLRLFLTGQIEEHPLPVPGN